MGLDFALGKREVEIPFIIRLLIELLLLLASLLAFWGSGALLYGQNAPKARTCTASAGPGEIVRHKDGTIEQWITVTADTGKQILYMKKVPAQNAKAVEKAMAEAARECVKWVSEGPKNKEKK